MKSSTVLDALKEIERARDTLRQLATNKPEGWKKDYALARGSLHDAVGKLADAGADWFAANAPAKAAEFGEVMKAARSKIDQHQARYPVLMIDSQGPDYKASMLEVDSRFKAMISFVHTHIGQ